MRSVQSINRDVCLHTQIYKADKSMLGTKNNQDVRKPSTSGMANQKSIGYRTIEQNKTSRVEGDGKFRKTLNFGHETHQQASQKPKRKANSYLNNSRYVNIDLNESLLITERPHNLSNPRKKTSCKLEAGNTRSWTNELRVRELERWREREPYIMMRKGRLITKVKCPCTTEINTIKNYMTIERINFMSSPYNLKMPGIKNQLGLDSVNPEWNTQRKELIVRRRVQSIKANIKKRRSSPSVKSRSELLQEFLIRKPALRKDYFIFGMSERNNQQNKTQNFRDFLWKVNYSNGLYVYTPQQTEKQSRFYVGRGNNCHLIRAMMRKRFWWIETERVESAHFIWTQLKQDKVYELQKNGTAEDLSEIHGDCDLQMEIDSPMKRLWNTHDLYNWERFYSKHKKTELKITEETYVKRLSLFKYKKIRRITNSSAVSMHNHLQFNFYVGNKKALFYCMRQYLRAKRVDPFQILPMTFHITQGVKDPEFKIFQQYFNEIQQKKQQNKLKNVWIVKPGENTNRGNGITVCYRLEDILIRLKGQERNKDGKLRTFIVQKYIEHPLLYCRRKFDIRHFMLVTCINGHFKGYWFEEGYLRTACNQFTLKFSKDPYVHLTNDAVQKNCQTYGRHEKGNKLSYTEFQKYVEGLGKTNKADFVESVLPKMRQIGTEAIRATYPMLVQNRKEHNFELLGLDFMIDEDFKPWLIEINTNPCLETSSSILQKMIPQLIDNTLKLCLDPLFPPPQNWQANRKTYFGDNPILQNKYTLVFDSACEGKQAEELLRGAAELTQQMGKLEEDAEIFEDDGDENWNSPTN